jgi:hypothetical protein
MKIDDNQMYLIDHYTSVVGRIAERIQSLCDSEKYDIVYGFELGTIYSDLKIAQVEISSVLDVIKHTPSVADGSTEAP